MADEHSLFIVHDHDNGGNQGSSETEDPTFRQVKIKEVTELGNVTSTSTCVKRDLGFQGKLGSYILVTYGDTLFMRAPPYEEFRGMICNSIAIACNKPTRVFDPVLDEEGDPCCLLRPCSEYGENPSFYSLGITNVVETSPGEGMTPFIRSFLFDCLSLVELTRVQVFYTFSSIIVQTSRITSLVLVSQKLPLSCQVQVNLHSHQSNDSANSGGMRKRSLGMAISVLSEQGITSTHTAMQKTIPGSM